MTHLEQLTQMLTSIGYDVKVEHECITISADGKNVDGYSGFVATFAFNPDGSLQGVGVYE